jgi:hypothetical protein
VRVFPIFEVKPSEALNLAEKLGEKTQCQTFLAGLENPVDVIADGVRKIGESQKALHKLP